MNIYKGAVVTFALCLLTFFALAEESKLTPEQLPNPNDGVGAVTKHLTDLRGYRYMEFFLVGSVPVDGQIKGTCYNTTTQNTPPGGRDSAPAALVQKLDPTALAKQFGVKGHGNGCSIGLTCRWELFATLTESKRLGSQS
jgi:hypothetical protein